MLHTHVRVLLAAAGSTGDLELQADALLALLDADYVTRQPWTATALRRTRRRLGKRRPQAVREVTGRWVLHVDLDQFLASVELRRHPELVGPPVIVGGSGDPTEPRKVVTCLS